MLSYEKLDVYKASIELLAISSQVLDGLPSGYSNLSDQLKRASLSVPLNIAEGSGKPSDTDAARFYGIARGSSMECGAVYDACRVLGVGKTDLLDEGKILIERIVSMLTRMCSGRIRSRSRPRSRPR